MKFRNAETESEFKLIHPNLKVILLDMEEYLKGYGKELYITDLISNPAEDKKLGRVSRSHSEKRAADIRIWDWGKEFKEKLEKHFEEKYKDWAAIGKETGLPNLILYHDLGYGNHAHVQICR